MTQCFWNELYDLHPDIYKPLPIPWYCARRSHTLQDMKRSTGDMAKSKINYATNKRRTRRDGDGKEIESTRNTENVTCHGQDKEQTFPAHCLPRCGYNFRTVHLVDALRSRDKTNTVRTYRRISICETAVGHR
jgi:hypothetical protein